MDNINKIITLFLILTGFLISVNAQNEEIDFWNSDIPGAIETKDYTEVNDTLLDKVKQVKTPTLKVFIPENPNGTAMVICPGGGYALLALKRAGYDVAEWLNTMGITAFVLKYRLPSDAIMQDKSIGPLQDAQASIRYIRRHAETWKINTQKVGVMGFSAGGHLAATLATRSADSTYSVKDGISAKPNFSVLIYPVISMQEDKTHKGSRRRLLGSNPSQVLIESFSNEMQVDSLTPPAFIAHATDDEDVSVENSLAYYQALRKNNVPTELHLFQDGGHAFFLGRKDTTSHYWTTYCEAWLRSNHYIN
jgi:acetyl esterase/lipase